MKGFGRRLNSPTSVFISFSSPQLFFFPGARCRAFDVIELHPAAHSRHETFSLLVGFFHKKKTDVHHHATPAIHEK